MLLHSIKYLLSTCYVSTVLDGGDLSFLSVPDYNDAVQIAFSNNVFVNLYVAKSNEYIYIFISI